MTDETQAPDAGLYLNDLVATGKPSLGNLLTVSHIVRHFGKFVLDKRAAFMRGDKGAENPLAAYEAEAALLGQIFTGHDDRFDAQPWNTDARLGNLFRVLCPQETKDFGEPAKGFFMWIAGQLVAMMVAMEEGGDESSIKQQMDDMLDDAEERLLGVKY